MSKRSPWKELSMESSDLHEILPPLQDASKQIRLIEFTSKSTGNPLLQCKLSIHDLVSVKDGYIAISYTWGDDVSQAAIEVDGKVIEVRLNCYEALIHARNHFAAECQYFWIDSVCIDQASAAEKQQQVKLMSSIFAEARLVAAYIGPAGCESVLFDEATTISVWHSMDLIDISWIKATLVQRPHFHRLWTVQECFLAKELRLMCGDEQRNLSAVRRILSADSRRLDAHTYEPDTFQQLYKFLENCDHKSLQYNPGVEFCSGPAEIVLRYIDRHCFDPRDKIYGVLSLLPRRFRYYLNVKYDSSLLQVLHDYVEAQCWNAAECTRDSPWKGYYDVGLHRFHVVMESIQRLTQIFKQSSIDFRRDLATLLKQHTVCADSIIRMKVPARPKRYSRTPFQDTAMPRHHYYNFLATNHLGQSTRIGPAEVLVLSLAGTSIIISLATFTEHDAEQNSADGFEIGVAES